MNYLGQNLAILELLLVTARTIWATDLRLSPGSTVGAGRMELGWGQNDPNQYVVKDYLVSKWDHMSNPNQGLS
jgi:hypothetical protein